MFSVKDIVTVIFSSDFIHTVCHLFVKQLLIANWSIFVAYFILLFCCLLTKVVNLLSHILIIYYLLDIVTMYERLF